MTRSIDEFAFSSDPAVGALLATLAAATPENSRIIELGTGAGAGLASLVRGVGERTDVHVVSVDNDAEQVAAVRAAGWPDYVEFVIGDAAAVIRERAPFDLVFADAPSGKIEGLADTIAALRLGGMLVVDDMDPQLHLDDGLLEPLIAVRDQIVAHPELISVELDYASGVIVATRRSSP